MVLLVSGPVGSGTASTRTMLATATGFQETASGLQAGFGTVGTPTFFWGPGWQFDDNSRVQHNWPVQLFLDFNGDGGRDWMYITSGASSSVRTQRNLTARPDLLIRVDDQSEGTQVTYSTLGDRAVHFITKECPADLNCPRRGGLIVSRLRRGNGTGGFNDSLYQYTDARVDPRGRGFLGFQSVRVTDSARGAVSTREYDVSFSEVVDGVLRFPRSRIPQSESTLVTVSGITGPSRTREHAVSRSIITVMSGYGAAQFPVTRVESEVTTSYENSTILNRVTNTMLYGDDEFPDSTSRVVLNGSRTDTSFVPAPSGPA